MEQRKELGSPAITIPFRHPVVFTNNPNAEKELIHAIDEAINDFLGLPSAADLDAVAEEERIKAETYAYQHPPDCWCRFCTIARALREANA